MPSPGELFQRWWRTNGEEPPLTDASTADNYINEDVILRFQKASKEVTDLLVKYSAAEASGESVLQKYRDSVIMAYAALLENNCEAAKKVLEKVVNK